jgi:uncharacterized protein (DUF433 family)
MADLRRYGRPLRPISARIWHDQRLAAPERARRLLKSVETRGVLPLLLNRLKACLTHPEGVAYERITINPNRMSGLPCIRDTQVTLSAVLGQLAAGRSIEEILVDYPYLERDDILAALEFATAAVQERELPLAQPA